MSDKIFDSVWDALEDNPVQAKNYRLRSELMASIAKAVQASGLSQAKVAEALGTTQPRVSALLNGKIEEFRLDMLVNFAHAMGLTVTLEAA